MSSTSGTKAQQARAERFIGQNLIAHPPGTAPSHQPTPEPLVPLAAARHARKLTQEQLAERLATPQTEVSRTERRADIKLSTMLRYLRGIGARDIHLAITFEDGQQWSSSLQRPDGSPPLPNR